MTVRDLTSALVGHSRIVITRTVTRSNGHRQHCDVMYNGTVRSLHDPLVLDSQVEHIVNSIDKTSDNPVAFLTITTKED